MLLRRLSSQRTIGGERRIGRQGCDAVRQMLWMFQAIIYEAPDRDVKQQYFILADGTGTTWLAHQYAYRRRPS